MDTINIHLLDKHGDVQYGLNWGHRDNRDRNQSYLQLPSDVYKSDFFPTKGTYFLVDTDDGQTFAMNRAQKTTDGTALQTPEDNSIIGKYIRTRLGLADGQEITVSDIISYGRLDIAITKVDDRHYKLDFNKDWKSDSIPRIYESYLLLKYYPYSDGKFPLDKIKQDLSYPSLESAITYSNGEFLKHDFNASTPKSLIDFAESDFLETHYFSGKASNKMYDSNTNAIQKIFYGAPGTGKSHTVDTDYVKDHKCFRITFHPDTDYASFVGCYKPTMDKDKPGEITYSFVPQVFINAYVYAWNHPDEPTFLVIEELNRGNCAQIFGDVFQLLDRQHEGHPGYSKYTINADSDIANYLEKWIDNADSKYKNAITEIYNPKAFDFSIMALPKNLCILATMNTSDQSLFPIDSAFKRRWEMEYVKVNYKDAEQFYVEIDKEHKYNWRDILLSFNKYIKGHTQSTNKILGNRFVQPKTGDTIDCDTFRDKVLFFLFNDVFKDNEDFTNDFFPPETEDKFFETLCESSDTNLITRFIEDVCHVKNTVTPAPSEEAAKLEEATKEPEA